ncbi:hypothetical protein E2562_023598 [Oryza meyeriana var. granulata]|uniref:Uncharacterized protein n=1 Tax=Oryza meyeriana var. granulata TaxID=110450 RepID=A0A6G1FBB9_9ORYZ|nr:hypothetical protein E2562_023598 [Oryza meyeriana var. granulata]
MCKRSCMAPSESCAARPAEERPAVCSCGAGPAAAAAVGTSSDHHQQPAVQAEAEAEKKKSRGADEAEGAGAGAGDQQKPLPVARRPAAGEESARERLKRHRTEMAGRVRIPEMWGQERLLKDWVDCAVFDRPLAATRGLLTARDALVAECAPARRPPHGRPLRVQNGCS